MRPGRASAGGGDIGAGAAAVAGGCRSTASSSRPPTALPHQLTQPRLHVLLEVLVSLELIKHLAGRAGRAGRQGSCSCRDGQCVLLGTLLETVLGTRPCRRTRQACGMATLPALLTSQGTASCPAKPCARIDHAAPPPPPALEAAGRTGPAPGPRRRRWRPQCRGRPGGSRGGGK